MSPEVREALENATTVGIKTDGFGVKRHRSVGSVRALVYAVVQELPGDMTLADLCEELDISASQGRFE